MHAERSFVRTAEGIGGEAREARRPIAGGFAGGVHWFGRADRTEGQPVRESRDRERTSQPSIVGTAHGPRLLELMCMAG